MFHVTRSQPEDLSYLPTVTCVVLARWSDECAHSQLRVQTCFLWPAVLLIISADAHMKSKFVLCASCESPVHYNDVHNKGLETDFVKMQIKLSVLCNKWLCKNLHHLFSLIRTESSLWLRSGLSCEPIKHWKVIYVWSIQALEFCFLFFQCKGKTCYVQTFGKDFWNSKATCCNAEQNIQQWNQTVKIIFHSPKTLIVKAFLLISSVHLNPYIHNSKRLSGSSFIASEHPK